MNGKKAATQKGGGFSCHLGFFDFDIYFVAAATPDGPPYGVPGSPRPPCEGYQTACGNLKPCRADGPGEPQEEATTGHAVIVSSASTAAIEYLEKRSR